MAIGQVVYVRLPPILVKSIKEAANKKRQSVNRWAQLAFEQALKEQNKGDDNEDRRD